MFIVDTKSPTQIQILNMQPAITKATKEITTTNNNKILTGPILNNDYT
jgi:hypothetical protein